MRLKTVPRRRRPHYSYSPTNNAREYSPDIMQDVTEEYMDIEKHGRMLESLKKPEAKMRQVPETTGAFNQKQFDEIGDCFDANNRVIDSSGAMNLCTRNNFRTADVKKETTSGSPALDCARSTDVFAGSLLYQIMTDPTFVENIKNTKNLQKLTCKFCKQIFVSDDEMRQHLEARLNESDHITCCACGKTFGQKRYLRYHQRCHVKKSQFTCVICTKIYSRMDNLTRHTAYHTNPDKYPCTMCKKAFSRRDLMIKHLKTHQEKKMDCDLCEGVFAGLAEMEAHRLSLHSAKNVN